MDPVSALSVAAAAVAFADFSANVVRGIVYAYRFVESGGSPEKFQQLRNDAERLKLSNLRLQRSLAVDVLKRQRTETEDDVLAVAGECIGVASSLLQNLTKYDLAKETPKIAAVRTAIKATVNKGKLEALNRTLVGLQQRLMAVVVLGLREDIGEAAKALADVRNANQSSLGGSSSVGEEILNQLKEVRMWQENLDLAFKQLRNDTKVDQSLSAVPEVGVNERLDNLFPVTALSNTLRDRLLRSLEFDEISTRADQVEDAHNETFEWIFAETETSWSNFAHWLEYDTGLYWISGKPASGKSTLMKFIVHHKKTRSLLRSWTGDAEPIIASFYFWNTGSNMQTSQEGLLQTLLHQALSQYKSLFPDAPLGRWESFALSKDFGKPWTWQELEKAFKYLLEDQDPSLKFCFFVDGLDEFKGDVDALITLTNKISQYTNAKICVSSRPWMVFEDSFRTKPQLLLQDLTHADIRKYVNDKLGDHPGFIELRYMDEESATALIDNVANYSSGVFLWVVLVVKSLLEGFRDGDHLSDLQKRLDDLPKELDDLFQRIMYNFDGRYFRDASVIFQLIKASSNSNHDLSLLELSLAEQADEESAIQAAIKPMKDKEKLHRVLNMRRRLQSRCKGLLEAGSVHVGDTFRDISEVLRNLSDQDTEHYGVIASAHVLFLHRTVSDFLSRPEIWEKFTAATGNSFQPYAVLLQAMLMKMKWCCPCENAFFDLNLILTFAYVSERNEGVCQFALLDEVDKVWHSFSPLIVHEETWGWDFLHLVVSKDLAVYLDSKLTQEPQLPARIWSLLTDALSGDSFFITGSHTQVVRVLLQHIELPESTKVMWFQLAEECKEKFPRPKRDEIENLFKDVNPFKNSSDIPSSAETTCTSPDTRPKSQRNSRKYLQKLIPWRKKAG